MDIHVFPPKNTALQPWIECFYVLSKTDRNEKIQYATFPSLNSILSFVTNADISYSKNKLLIKQNDDCAIDCMLTCQYKKPVTILYEGIVQEITIYFKPLGLNAFLQGNLIQYSKHEFSRFIPSGDFLSGAKTIMDIDNVQNRVAAMEAFWLKRLVGFEHPFMNDVVAEMVGSRGDAGIGDIAEQHGISRKTLHKHFLQHICRSPSEFRKIVKFRGLSRDVLLKIHKTFTKASYHHNFFDQSHFIREFESLTGNIAPRDYFKKIRTHGNGEINWIYAEQKRFAEVTTARPNSSI
jgi:AraC-like DNA-binding protein